MLISIIAAMDHNQLIGNNNQLPWHLPADFAHFKKVTMGKPIIMGRKTYDSIGKPLPGRKNIVLSRNPDLKIEGVECVSGFSQAISLLDDNVDEVMIIGGSSIYEMLLPKVNRMYITYVEDEFSGDAWFPVFDKNEWLEVEVKEHTADEINHHNCTFVTLDRK